jgi:hypothetical protein
VSRWRRQQRRRARRARERRAGALEGLLAAFLAMLDELGAALRRLQLDELARSRISSRAPI